MAAATNPVIRPQIQLCDSYAVSSHVFNAETLPAREPSSGPTTKRTKILVEALRAGDTRVNDGGNGGLSSDFVADNFNQPGGVLEVHARSKNTLYGYILGKKVAFQVAKRCILNAWQKYGVTRVIGINMVYIAFNFLVQLVWSKELTFVLVWINFHSVSVSAFTADGLSAIATRLGTPIMLDSCTVTICVQCNIVSAAGGNGETMSPPLNGSVHAAMNVPVQIVTYLWMGRGGFSTFKCFNGNTRQDDASIGHFEYVMNNDGSCTNVADETLEMEQLGTHV
ncbi:hypothetical protein Tco_1253295 [Tanacetum coccineum]